MRITFILTLILLVAAFAVAQQGTPPQSAPAGQSQAEPGMPSHAGMPGQAGTQPGTTAGQAGAPSMGGDIIEGCLGGASPNYTVTDKAGTTYQLEIPAGADATVLAKHVGESIQVQGSMDNANAAPTSKSQASAGTTSSSATSGKAIKVARIGRGTGTCPGSSSNPGSSTNPSSTNPSSTNPSSTNPKPPSH